MEQNRFTLPGPVLDSEGRPVPGYSTRAVLVYDRSAIRAKPWRIKEWDYYQVSDGEKCLELTYGHASYVGQVGVMMFDFRKGEWIINKSCLLPLPFSRMGLPANAEQDSIICYEKKGICLRFEVRGNSRMLFFQCKDFEAKVELTRCCQESIAVNVPFLQNPHQFYYNQKINCMSANGNVRAAGREYRFSPDSSFGLLDWGRGVWPFSNEWYWSNGTGLLQGELFGFNLGCGFGDSSHGTENVLFYKGASHKLGVVKIEHGEDFMGPWTLRDSVGRVNLTMKPMFDRTTSDKVLFINNCCHQVFGLFSGIVVLDDGDILQVNDLPAFAEHAINNW